MDLVSVESVLDAVIVYAEGAICRRLARLSLPEGPPPVLRLIGLPLSLVEGSLRASVVSGPAGLRVRDVRPAFDVVLPPEADIPEEQKALEQAEERVQQLEMERDLLGQRSGDLASLRPVLLPREKGAPPWPTPLEATLAFVDYVDEQLRGLNRRRREVEAALEDARNEATLRRRRLQESTSAVRAQRARLDRAAVVTLGAARASGDVELALEYLVPGATWAPMYDLRLDRAGRQGTLAMRASVAQRTGEDWTGVRLSLSTARLDRRIELPELSSLRIGKHQPAPPRSGWREPPPGLAELFAGYDLARADHPLPAPRTASASRPEPPPPPSPPPPDQRVRGARMSAMAISDDDGAASGGERLEEVEGAPEADMLEADVAPQPVPTAAPARKGPPPAPALQRSVPAAPPALAAPPPAPRAAARPGRRRSVTGEMAAVNMHGLREAVATPPSPPELEPEPGLLDYGRLILAGPDEGARRGKLRPANVGEWEIGIFAQVAVHVDVVAILATHRQEAARIARKPRPPHTDDVRQSAGSFDYRFDAERRVDVRGDGAWHTVPVFAAEVGIAPEYVCVPSVDPRVYRAVTLSNRSPHALLRGPMDVTLGDEFLMTVPLPTIAPGGSSRVGLGVEEGIKVSRNTRFNETTGGLLGGAAVLSHGVEIEVANRLAGPVDVEVQERMPVTSEKDVRIEEGPVQPPWSSERWSGGAPLAEGARTWRVRLEPGETRRLSAQYAIRIPNQKALVGGNRRS